MGILRRIRRGLVVAMSGGLLSGVALAGDGPGLDELGLVSELEPVEEETLADSGIFIIF